MGGALGWFIEVSGTALIGSRPLYLRLRYRELEAQRAVRWAGLSKSRVQPCSASGRCTSNFDAGSLPALRAVRWTDLTKSQVRRGLRYGGVPQSSI